MQQEAWNSNFELNNWILSCNGSFWRQHRCFLLFFPVFSLFFRLWKPPRRPYFADASYMWYLSKKKLKIQSLNFELLFALLTSNITYTNRLRSMAVEEASTDEKAGENSKNTVLLAPKLAVTAQISNFWIQILNCELLFALLTSNITYMKRLWSMGAEEASTDEKTVKNSEKQVLTPKLAVTAQNSKFEFKIWRTSLFLHHYPHMLHIWRV